MNASQRKVNYPQFAFWTALLVVVLVLLYQQTISGMRLISLPGLFLSLGMLCLLSRGFYPSVQWMRRLLFGVAMALFALSLTASLRLLLSR